MKTVKILTVNSSLGGPIKHSGLISRLFAQENRFLQARIDNNLCLQELFPESSANKNSCIQMLNQYISQFSQSCIQQQQSFMVVSGDHSSAMGTWAGVLNALQSPDQFGLLWLDAHLDAHTYLSSPSGNCHGMPVAALLGLADARLKKLYPSSQHLNANNLLLLGARSYEEAELKILRKVSVEIIFANQITNFKQAFISAYQKLNKSCTHIGISIDLDIIDPREAPAVATPVSCGINTSELLDALANIHGHRKWCGLECAEFIPSADINHRTLHLLMEIMCLYSSHRQYRFSRYK